MNREFLERLRIATGLHHALPEEIVDNAETNRALLHEAAEMLRRVEWSFERGEFIYRCPECHEPREVGHDPDCPLAALLRKLPE